MRIISGKYKSRPILAPKSQNTRPTADNVKEALFSIIGPQIKNANVWDVFAGSGALGLEALSRGAQSALFTEASAKALEVVKANLKALEAQGTTKLWRAPNNLARLGLSENYFDIIFLDPPYDSNLAWPTLLAISQQNLAAPNCLALWEHDKIFKPKIAHDAPWQLTDTRNWGRRAFSFLVLAE